MRSTTALCVLLGTALPASAQPGAEDPNTTGTAQVEEDYLQPPSAVEIRPALVVTKKPPKRPLATDEPWGGGVRLTGLSGIGALPGVNYGGELAVLVRYQEAFAELGLGKWKPEKQYIVTETPERVELKLDVWTLRAGWASMQTPLRLWGLVEAGEIASARGMPGVVTRMMTGETPTQRRWQAIGAGFGVAWPMSQHARLFGMIEFAVPRNQGDVLLDQGMYQPDPLAARSSAGLELGWR